MATLYGRGGQYKLDDGRFFVPKMNDETQFATDLGEKWLTADTWGSPLVKMDMPQWTNNVTRNGGGLQFDIGPMSHYAGEGYVSNSPFNVREAEKDKDPGLLGSMFNPTLMKALAAVGGTLGAAGALGALGSGAGASGAAGAGAFDAGGLGAAEAMGLGGGYTSPALGAGVGGSVDMTGFLTNNNVFSYTPEFSYGNLSGVTPGEFTLSQLPGGSLSQYAGLGGVGGGMVDLGAAGAIAGVDAGASGLSGVLQKVAQNFGTDAAKSLASKIINGDATAEDMLAGFARAIPGLLGAGASSLLSGEAQDLARKYMEFGAPSRARFEASFAPGFSMANEPGYKDALDQTTKSFLHKASIGGNPADSPNAWMQTLKDVNSTFAFPALQNYRSVNAGAGGMASLSGSVPTFDMTSLKQTQNIADSLGGAAADVFNPPKTLSDLLKQARVVY